MSESDVMGPSFLLLFFFLAFLKADCSLYSEGRHVSRFEGNRRKEGA